MCLPTSFLMYPSLGFVFGSMRLHSHALPCHVMQRLILVSACARRIQLVLELFMFYVCLMCTTHDDYVLGHVNHNVVCNFVYSVSQAVAWGEHLWLDYLT